MIKFLLLICLLVVQRSFGQQNHVFSGAEIVNFGILDLATPGGQQWSTDRSSTPGYFSATNMATYSGASDAANINGYVKKYGNTAFTFPVGDQTGNDLRTLSISAPNSASDEIGVAYWKGDAGTSLDPTGGAHDRNSLNPAGASGSSKLTSVSPIGFWDWVPISGTSSVTVTVSLPDFSGTGGYASASGMRLAGWNVVTGQWDNLSGTTGATGTAEGSTLTGTMANMSNYSAIAVGNVSMLVLPVTLVSFRGRMQNCNAVLTWSTAYEEDMDYFEIMKSSNAQSYTAIDKVSFYNNPSGSNYTATYIQNDADAYYLLKMVDIRGTTTFSNIVFVKSGCSSAASIIVYPTPQRDG